MLQGNPVPTCQDALAQELRGVSVAGGSRCRLGGDALHLDAAHGRGVRRSGWPSSACACKGSCSPSISRPLQHCMQSCKLSSIVSYHKLHFAFGSAL